MCCASACNNIMPCHVDVIQIIEVKQIIKRSAGAMVYGVNNRAIVLCIMMR